ncbi:MAG: PCRF domain-containing protein, partial [Bacteroidales bacterium]|nr:PCRF domain-containing protein [Bacteroidales bacterium]
MAGKQADIAEKEKQTEAPDFWDDPKKAEQLQRQISGIRSWVEQFNKTNTAMDDLEVLFDFFQAQEATE